MKRALVASALALGLLGSTAAHAQEEGKDKAGSLGVGADVSLLGLGGLSARYQLSPVLGLQGILFFQNTSVADTSARDLSLVLRGDYRLAARGMTAVSAVFGLDIAYVSLGDDSDTDFGLEVGARAEHFLADNLSIHMETGLVIALGDDTVISLGLGAADLFGSAGFTFWF